jgi:hypothetical protein
VPPDGDAPFRTATHAHSATLARLAARHPAAEAIHAVERRTDTDELVGIALGDPAPIGCLMMVGYVGTLAVALAWSLGWLPLVAVAIGGGTIVAGGLALAIGRRRWRRRTQAALAWTTARGFPIVGVRGFFAATVPMIDVSFATPPTVDAFAAGIRGHTGDARVVVIDDATYRVELPVRGSGGGDADAAWLLRFVDEVLAPLHDELGIASVQLGGGVRAPDALAAGDAAVTPPGSTSA